jgi:CTP:molybdopterin cytidylyltransferase MocA
VTVAAIILAASPDSALADADGLPSVRRIADVAWSGGAVPIVVVAHDPDGAVAAALAGAPVTLAEPAPVELGPAGQMARGIEVAQGTVHETTGALIWPSRLTWVGPETVTSLIEAHGPGAAALLVPTYDGEPGWPVLLPVTELAALRAVAPTTMPPDVVEELGARMERRLFALGDPGVTHDRSTPRADLPPYAGPSEPAGGHVHEWGAVIADDPDEGPLEGPALAPYGQAAADTEADLD